ncbi:MAG: septal ring lytic transglycosylase RlpA family protein [Candidatus Aminicenantes bacterium]|nr:septal ring lytic transglycosylase RlpA family protein [Candidatus Aminicenantes bacterium]HHF51964.1 septal ring lytic transglycosylase RlpA family protein [Candidatus Aminicenantes bacterium]
MNHRGKTQFVFMLFAVVMIFFSSCSRNQYKTTPAVITGQASWYGPHFHGKTTSSQEVFDMYDMTAAHKSLPFGTYVMVTNLDNGRSVKVRINDRGPFIRGRVIDLSYAAAKVLGMVGTGVVPVRIEILSDISVDADGQRFAVQVGAFVVKENAEALKSRLDKKYNNVYISQFKTPNRVYYRVRLSFDSRSDALKTAKSLQKQGLEVFIVEYQE